jgi:formate hydrogenlyase subunit 6/NADH:ubiquinone oxidoreductase subunit I
MNDTSPAAFDATGPRQKWLPAIARDDCTGCALCLRACERGCLDLVWDFATLQRPEDCGSCGRCAQACPHDVIQMSWSELLADRRVGRWQLAPVRLVETPRRPRWLAWLRGADRGGSSQA